VAFYIIGSFPSIITLLRRIFDKSTSWPLTCSPLMVSSTPLCLDLPSSTPTGLKAGPIMLHRCPRHYLPYPVRPNTQVGRPEHPLPFRRPSKNLQSGSACHLGPLVRLSHRSWVFPPQHARGFHIILNVSSGHAWGSRPVLCLPLLMPYFSEWSDPLLSTGSDHIPILQRFVALLFCAPSHRPNRDLTDWPQVEEAPRSMKVPLPPPLPTSPFLGVWLDTNRNKITATLALYTPLGRVSSRSKPWWTTTLSELR